MQLISLLMVIGGLAGVVTSYPAVFDQSSLAHLIIPYEDDVVIQPQRPIASNEEPYVITTYNVGTFRGGDHLEVPLGASYTVAGPGGVNRLKKGAFEKRFKPGIVL